MLDWRGTLVYGEFEKSWRVLAPFVNEDKNDYRLFVRNKRASPCPSPPLPSICPPFSSLLSPAPDPPFAHFPQLTTIPYPFAFRRLLVNSGADGASGES